jgi:hypothetical protein
MIGIRDRLKNQFEVDKRTATMLLVLAGITLVAITLGLWLDSKDFALNLLAGVAGLGVAVIAGVLLFERLAREAAYQEQQVRLAAQEQQQREKWEGVRIATLTALWDQLRRVTRPIMILSPNYTIAAAYPAAIEVMKDVLAWVNDQAADPLSEDWPSFRSKLLSLEQNLHREYLPIRDILIPRVLEYADDADLVERLFVLDAKERRFEEWVFVTASGTKKPTATSYPSDVWRRMQAFLAAAIEVAVYIQPRPAQCDSDRATRLPEEPPEGIVTLMGGDGHFHTVAGIDD